MIQSSIIQWKFPAISMAFHANFFSSGWVGGGIYDGADCNRHPPVITPILHF
jgi:hypothetical protein